MEKNADFKKFSAKFFLTPGRIVWIFVLVVGLIGASTCFFKVDETEQAVITRFGKYYTTLGPGLQFKLPFGIDKSYNVPVKVLQTEQFGFQSLKSGVRNEYKNNIVDESTMLTGDLNIVDVEWIIQYRIVDPSSWLFNVKDRRQTIRDISRSAINALVGDRAILDIMGQERTSIENLATENMNVKFKELGLGINVTAVNTATTFVSFQPPSSKW